MQFEFDNNIPIYIQLVDILKKDIISGNLKPGEKIPSVRDLASTMKVNPNTMQKALSELENMKLIYTERTNGSFVSTDKKLIEKYKYTEATNLFNKFFSSMESIGFEKSEALKYLKDLGGD